MEKKVIGIIVFTTEEITKKTWRNYLCRKTWCYVISKTPTPHNINKIMKEKCKWFKKECGCDDILCSIKHLIVINNDLNRDRGEESLLSIFLGDDWIYKNIDLYNLNKNPIHF